VPFAVLFDRNRTNKHDLIGRPKSTQAIRKVFTTTAWGPVADRINTPKPRPETITAVSANKNIFQNHYFSSNCGTWVNPQIS
jgi:hypothetical protein